MNRRLFLKKSGLFLATTSILPYSLYRLFSHESEAATLKSMGVSPPAASAEKTLVFIFLRGGMDGLSLLPPTSDPHYFEVRKNISIPALSQKPAIKLDPTFSLHPGFASLKKHWDEGTLAFVTQSGSPDTGRSHFDSQDFIESGTPGNKSTESGFLNRALIPLEPSHPSPIRAVALQSNMPRILTGPFPALSMNALNDFGIHGPLAQTNELNGFESMYQQATDQIFRGTGKEVFQTSEIIKAVQNNPAFDPKLDRAYPRNGLASHLRDIASLIKSKVGLQVAVTDMGGWDTHVNQGNQDGQLADRFTELSDSLAAFAKDLGPDYANVCVIAMTEFGRTVKENGSKGTDHGHGSVTLLMGGSVKGKKIYGKWKDLSEQNLFESRDIPVSTDFRTIFSEALNQHLRVQDLSTIFPKFDLDPKKWIEFL